MVSVVYVESMILVSVLAPIAVPLLLAVWLARKYSAFKEKGGEAL